jgi:hypothetical protein
VTPRKQDLMAFNATSPLSPTARLIIAFLTNKPEPQSAINISEAVGATYWTARDLAQKLVAQGVLRITMVGKSPHCSLATTSDSQLGGAI